MTAQLVAVSNFVRRQTKDSEFSYFDGTEEELVDRVTKSFSNALPGYRDGVILVPVSPIKFYTSVIQLREGDELVGEFKARRDGELPTKNVRVVGGQKLTAGAVDIVLYHKDVLAENNERSSNAEWEIVSINARPDANPMPISVGALMRNYFGEPGGTDTKMTAEEFVEQLKISRAYWRDKALAAPNKT